MPKKINANENVIIVKIPRCNDMNGTEIISYLSANAPAIWSGMGPVVGSLITVLFLRKNTTATEFEKIKAGKYGEVLEDLLLSGHLTYTELYKANNFLTIAKKADEYYSTKRHVETTDCFEFDWLIRYYEAVGNISDESMQDIWAKILAGEISTPSSYSLKTIDTLRNMRKCDVELFTTLCRYSFDCADKKLFLPNYRDYMESVGIEYSDVMKLGEMGLIFDNGMLTMNFNLPSAPAILSVNRELVLTICSSEGKDTEGYISQFPFTQVGIELATLVGDMPMDEDFILFGKSIAKNKKYSVGIHKIIAWENYEPKYEEVNMLNCD